MATEGKFLRAGQVLIQMFRFFQDVAFIKELVLRGKRPQSGCALIAAEDPDFYRRNYSMSKKDRPYVR